MADNEEVEETASRGNEWEVVSLTASAYAAAPGPKEAGVNDDNRGHIYAEDETELTRSLFMSGHFVFPPSQHENLPLEPDISEIQNESRDGAMTSDLGVQYGRSSGKDKENSTVKKDMAVDDEFPGMQFFDEKGGGLTIPHSELEEQTTLLRLDTGSKGQDMYSGSAYGSIHSENPLSGSATSVGGTHVPQVTESPDNALCIPENITAAKKEKRDGSGLPCEAWWKRRAVAFCSHAKEANACWSVFVAAAVMGLVILGQHWQQERWHALLLKWQSSIGSENTGRFMGPISRLKDVIVGGQHRASFVKGSASD